MLLVVGSANICGFHVQEGTVDIVSGCGTGKVIVCAHVCVGDLEDAFVWKFGTR